MPVITAIKPQKSQKRVNIYLDGKFGFGIDLENFMKLRLKVEQELMDEEIEKIVKKAEFQKTLDRLLKFATLRPRSEKEMKDYFKRKKIHESLLKELFNRLNRLDLIDDQKFAEWWIDQRLEFKFKSKRELISELRLKGIDKDVIEDVLSESNINEEKAARQLMEKRGYKWKNLPKREANQKKYQYLAGKGFSWDVISKVVDRNDLEE